MAYQAFYELEAWKKARAFKLSVYEILKRLPKEEKFELYSQLRRAARSIPANISEGHGRFTFKDQSNYCVIARGSHAETLNHLIDAFDCGYITREELVSIRSEWEETGKLLNGYLAYLKARTNTNQNGNISEDDPYFEPAPDPSEGKKTLLDHLDTAQFKSVSGNGGPNQPIN